jgi:hypothetical protein
MGIRPRRRCAVQTEVNGEMPQRAVERRPPLGIHIWNPMCAPVYALMFVVLILENLYEMLHSIILEARYKELVS